jgi:hypothetical protein
VRYFIREEFAMTNPPSKPGWTVWRNNGQRTEFVAACPTEEVARHLAAELNLEPIRRDDQSEAKP